MSKLTHAEYCHNITARQNASCFVYPNGLVVCELDGEYYSQNEFKERFPIEGTLINWKQKKHGKGEDIDKTHIPL